MLDMSDFNAKTCIIGDKTKLVYFIIEMLSSQNTRLKRKIRGGNKMNQSIVLANTERLSTIEFQNIKFRKFVKLKNHFVYLEIKPMRSDEIIIAKSVYTLDDIDNMLLQNELEVRLSEWIDDNVTELEKVYAVLENY